MTRSLTISARLSLVLALGAFSSGCILKSEVGFASGGSGGDGSAGGAGGGGGAPAAVPELIFDNNIGVNPWNLAVDATTVYFTDAQGPDGKVLSVAKAGGPATVMQSGINSPTSIAVDATDVYFMDTYSLYKMPTGGGALTTVAAVENAGYGGLVIDDDNVYWTNYTGLGGPNQIAKAGGPVIALESSSHDPSGLVVTGGTVYWAAFSDNAIRSVPIGGGAVTDVALNQDAVRLGLAADSTHLYWLTEGDFPEEIWRAPLDGSSPPAQIGVSPSQASVPSTMVVDADYVYVSVPYCTLVRIPVAGGAALVTDVDPALGCPRLIAADADNIYYTSDEGVTRYPKSAL